MSPLRFEHSDLYLKRKTSVKRKLTEVEDETHISTSHSICGSKFGKQAGNNKILYSCTAPIL